MASSFVVYIDESGDEGFRFSSGSSRWFVLSAAITYKPIDLETVKLLDVVRDKLNKQPKKELHFRNLSHAQRLPYCQEIGGARVRAVSIAVHKPSLREPETFHQKYRLYFYAVRYLLERVSWLCRDSFKRVEGKPNAGTGEADLVFSNRSSMSYDDIRSYLSKLESQSSFGDIRIDWNVISHARLVAIPHKLRMGLQIADAIASSFFFGLETSATGFTEGRYARMLKPIMYRHNGGWWGHGLKVWPRESESELDLDGVHDWVREYQ